METGPRAEYGSRSQHTLLKRVLKYLLARPGKGCDGAFSAKPGELANRAPALRPGIPVSLVRKNLPGVRDKRGRYITQERESREHADFREPETLSGAETGELEERKKPKKESTSSIDARSTRLHNGECATARGRKGEYDGAEDGVAWIASLDRPKRTRRRREEKGEGALAPCVPLLRKEAGNPAQPAHSGRALSKHRS